MSNLAKQRFRVEFYGEYWVVWTEQGVMLTCTSKQQLLLVMQGEIEKAFPPPMPKSRLESMEEFLARGGVIQRVKVKREVEGVLSLESLGLAEPAPPCVPGVPVYPTYTSLGSKR